MFSPSELVQELQASAFCVTRSILILFVLVTKSAAICVFLHSSFFLSEKVCGFTYAAVIEGNEMGLKQT